MRVDQAVVAYVAADVDVHRWHADNAAPQIRSIAHGGSPRHDADSGRGAEAFQWKRVLVEERGVPARRVIGADRAAAEADQDPLLHPGIDPPAGRRRAIGFSGAHATRRQLLAQPRECGARLIAVCVGGLIEQALDLLCASSGRRRSVHPPSDFRWCFNP